jgi:glycerol-3-phosphate dehydrogenase
VLAVADEDRALARRIVPGLPCLMAEVIYACRFEMAMTLGDVLSRRTRLVLEDRQQGTEAAREVAALMARELGWDAAEQDRQVTAYLETVRTEYQANPATGARRPPQQPSKPRRSREDWSNATIDAVEE